MKNEHGYCPNCNADLDGGSIWETFKEKYTAEMSLEEAEKKADETASHYGATRTKGQWGREIGIYDMEKDMTVAYKCPDCGHEWSRK